MLVVLQHRDGQHGAHAAKLDGGDHGRVASIHVARPFGGIDDLRHLLVQVGQAFTRFGEGGRRVVGGDQRKCAAVPLKDVPK